MKEHKNQDNIISVCFIKIFDTNIKFRAALTYPDNKFILGIYLCALLKYD